MRVFTVQYCCDTCVIGLDGTIMGVFSTEALAEQYRDQIRGLDHEDLIIDEFSLDVEGSYGY